MLPFEVLLRPGESPYRQIAFAVKESKEVSVRFPGGEDLDGPGGAARGGDLLVGQVAAAVGDHPDAIATADGGRTWKQVKVGAGDDGADEEEGKCEAHGSPSCRVARGGASRRAARLLGARQYSRRGTK